jgi:adenylate cyclase
VVKKKTSEIRVIRAIRGQKKTSEIRVIRVIRGQEKTAISAGVKLTSVRKLIAGVLIGVGAAVVALGLRSAGMLDRLEMTAYDWRMERLASPANVNPDIVLVEINDTTLHDVSAFAGRWPWPRVVHSYLFDFLKRAPAKVIAFDLLLSEPDTRPSIVGGQEWTAAQSDAALADSVGANGNVIVLADAVAPGGTEDEDRSAAPWSDRGYRIGALAEERRLVLPPYEALTRAANEMGHNYLPLDRDGPARRMPPFIRNKGRDLPSLGIATAIAALGIKPSEVSTMAQGIRLRDRVIPLVGRDMLVNYRVPALVEGKRPYRSYEARHLIASEDQLLAGQKPLVDPSEFKDKIVFIGTSAAALVDVFQTPFGKATMPGIQVHASMADSVLANRFIRRATTGSQLGAAAAAAVAIGVATALLPYAAAATGAVVLMAVWTWMSIVLFRAGTWTDLVMPVAAIAIALFGGTAYRYFVEDREKRKVRGLFGRYVAKDVCDQLIENPALAELGGKRREMTVLFSDIRGFTTVTEKGNPEELVAQLNEYFTRMVEVVFRHHGTIDKFVGDMVMALFGAPLDDEAHADHAAAAACDMVRELGELNRKWAAEGRARLDIGVGINSGEMIAGNIGSSSIMSYTVIGDNVNLGSRLESLNKEYATRIIISDATRARLKEAYDVRPLGDVVVKGKTRPVAIFEIRVPSPLGEPQGQTL